jgi:hypothetical protein
MTKKEKQDRHNAAVRLGKAGGDKNVANHSHAHFVKIGSMNKKKYGPDYFKEIRKGIKPSQKNGD